VEAVKWWRKAGEQNLAKAQCNLGNCYRDGQGVAKDEIEAVVSGRSKPATIGRIKPSHFEVR